MSAQEIEEKYSVRGEVLGNSLSLTLHSVELHAFVGQSARSMNGSVGSNPLPSDGMLTNQQPKAMKAQESNEVYKVYQR